MRDQVELSFLIGYSIENGANSMYKNFDKRVIELACKMCGGCAVIPTEGYWMSDGASNSISFSGKLEQERTLHIKLSCELVKERMVYETMRAYISQWAELFGIDTDWVHVQRVEFEGMHFSTKETRANMSAVDRRDILSPGTRWAHT